MLYNMIEYRLNKGLIRKKKINIFIKVYWKVYFIEVIEKRCFIELPKCYDQNLYKMSTSSWFTTIIIICIIYIYVYIYIYIICMIQYITNI